jgi:N-acetylmuramoyl-L-alanine amidase-like protein
VRALDRIVMHHSATPSGSVDAFAAVHRQKGFGGVGYHIVICNGKGGADGEIQRGLPDDVKGVAVKKNNTGSLHVCVVGNFHAPERFFTGKPTRMQMASLGKVLADWKHKYAAIKLQLTDHRTDALPDYPTACPGSEFKTSLIQEWYKGDLSLGSKNLHIFLEERGYWKDWDDDKGGDILAKPVSVELTEAGVVQPYTKGLIIDGVTWVPLRDIAKAAGWHAPVEAKTREGERIVRQIIG